MCAMLMIAAMPAQVARGDQKSSLSSKSSHPTLRGMSINILFCAHRLQHSAPDNSGAKAASSA